MGKIGRWTFALSDRQGIARGITPVRQKRSAPVGTSGGKYSPDFLDWRWDWKRKAYLSSAISLRRDWTSFSRLAISSFN